MTAETQSALDRAQAAHDAASAAAREAEERLLSAVAASLPTNVDAIGKQLVEKDVDLARELGKKRMTEMRAELKAGAEAFGERLRTSAESLDWKENSIGSFGPGPFLLMDVLTPVFDRQAVRLLLEPFLVADFDVDERNYGAGDFAPSSQHVDEREAVLTALSTLHDASRVRTAAQADHDKADASDLWS